MPFALAYGSEAIILTEVIIPTLRSKLVDSHLNKIHLCHNLDLLEEKRKQTHIKLAAYHQLLARYYNRCVRRRAFRVGVYVLRRVQSNPRKTGAGKLGPNWEDSYHVTFAAEKGAYYLKISKGTVC